MSEPQRFMPGLALLIGVAVLEVLLLGIAGPPPSHVRVLAGLLSPMAEPLEGVLASLALAAEALAAYLVLALALRTLTHLPGFAGRMADRGERMLTVPAVRRVLDALLGGALIAHLALAPASTGAKISTVLAPSPAIATATASIEHSQRPETAPPVAPESRTPGIPASTRALPPIPLPIWLGGAPALRGATSSPGSDDLTARHGPVEAPQWAAAPVLPPALSTGGPGPAGTTRASGPPRTGPAAAYHPIEPGDTLWSIAMRHLPREARAEAAVARYWRRIYSANRGAIGPDPNRIHPGVTLSVPSRPTSTAPSLSSGPAPAAAARPESSALTDDPPEPLS